MNSEFDPILNEQELAHWIDVSRPTLQRHRSEGDGPPFVQLSARRIGYRKSAVEQWLQERTIKRVGDRVPFTSTANRGDVTATATANVRPDAPIRTGPSR